MGRITCVPVCIFSQRKWACVPDGMTQMRFCQLSESAKLRYVLISVAAELFPAVRCDLLHCSLPGHRCFGAFLEGLVDLVGISFTGTFHCGWFPFFDLSDN